MKALLVLLVSIPVLANAWKATLTGNASYGKAFASLARGIVLSNDVIIQ